MFASGVILRSRVFTDKRYCSLSMYGSRGRCQGQQDGFAEGGFGSFSCCGLIPFVCFIAFSVVCLVGCV